MPDLTYSDRQSAEIVIATLKDLARTAKPFFYGVVFKLPYLDWLAPKKYWDL